MAGTGRAGNGDIRVSRYLRSTKPRHRQVLQAQAAVRRLHNERLPVHPAAASWAERRLLSCEQAPCCC